MTPIDRSANLLRTIQLQVIRKYGAGTTEAVLMSNCILDFNRRILLWLRNEPGFDITTTDPLYSRITSAIKALLCWIKVQSVRPCDYIFFPTNETHLIQHIPVAKTIQSRGGKVLIVVNRKRLLREIPASLPTLFLSAVYNPLQVRFRKINVDDAPFDLSFIGRSESRSSILTFMMECLAKISAAKVIIVGNDLSLEGQVSRVAFHKFKRKVYTIQHGGVSNPIHGFSRVDYFFAFGNRSKTELIRNGFPANKILVCGAPYLSSILYGRNLTGSVFSKLGFSEVSKKVCLILLSGPGHSTSSDHNRAVFAALMDASLKLSQVAFIFKLHAKDKEENYEEFKGKTCIHFLNNSLLNSANVSVFNLIQEADLIVSGASASILEALYFSKPVLSIDLKSEYESIDFIKAGVTMRCTTHNSVVENLVRFFQDQIDLENLKQRSQVFISEYYYKGENPPETLIADELMKS